jgi:predicted DNA-binding transcriptional regulator AlpA
MFPAPAVAWTELDFETWVDVQLALRRSSRTALAKSLGVSRTTLWRTLKHDLPLRERVVEALSE